ASTFFFKDRAPPGWNQWAEVVSHTPREPFFVGDLPHAWVASDFVRSALDMFAYEREHDASIVLAAGVPVDWLTGKGIAVDGLRTAHGRLNFSLQRSERKLSLRVAEGLLLPEGGLVLPWPYEGTPGEASINGEPVPWSGTELRIMALPATVAIAIPAELRRDERARRRAGQLPPRARGPTGSRCADVLPDASIMDARCARRRAALRWITAVGEWKQASGNRQDPGVALPGPGYRTYVRSSAPAGFVGGIELAVAHAIHEVDDEAGG